MLLLLALLAPAIDDFDRLEGPVLTALAKGKEAKPSDRLTIAELGSLPRVLADARSALVIARTGEGNPARLLVSPGLRKPSGEGPPVPILVLERFDTFEAGPATSRVARGKEVVLFDGYRYDLDAGQVVPEGQGGDVQFLGDAKGGGPRLVALAGTKLYTLERSPLAPDAGPDKPSPGRAVIPGDFAGKYRLFANGQFSGSLELRVGEGGVITGQFRSDQTGSSYKVTGQAAGDAPQQVQFSIQFPRARQDFNGRLFTEGKGALAGTMTMLDKDFGFFALREGGRFAPADAEAKAPEIAPAPKPEK